MIKPNELRIGNFVEDRVDIKNIKTTQITLDDFVAMSNYSNSRHPNYYKPIPLTPEWLERCGFTALEYGVWDGPKIEMEDSIEWFTIEEYRGGYILKGSEWVMGKPFKHLHQLQNLYFALTGEELTIKEPA